MTDSAANRRMTTSIDEHRHHNHHHPLLQVLCIFFYVASWVANAEALQGICNGTFWGTHGQAYNKPGFLTWLDYNLMILGFVLVWPWIRRNYGTLPEYVHVWTGTWSLTHMVLACTGLSWLLTITHIFYVVGLQNIFVASLNAAYQVQAICTLVLSVWVFGGAFTNTQMIGISTSIIGVISIVLPPLWLDDTDNNQESSTTSAAVIGIFSTILSAALWGCYQVAWRGLQESKLPKRMPQMTKTEELVDTIFTLAVIGVANLLVGWSILPILDWIGFETFELPPVSSSGALTINAVIEYLFNVLIAIAIHVTSPLATSLTAPLTIPLSWVSDLFLYQIPLSSATGGGLGWTGAILIMFGLYLLELKSDDDNVMQCNRRESSTISNVLLSGENENNDDNDNYVIVAEDSRLVLA